MTWTPFSLECLNEYGDLVWYPSKLNADFLQGTKKDWYVNISWTPLTGRPFNSDELSVNIASK